MSCDLSLILDIETTTDVVVVNHTAVRDFVAVPILLIDGILGVRRDLLHTTARARELFQHIIVNAEAFVTHTRVQSVVHAHSVN